MSKGNEVSNILDIRLYIGNAGVHTSVREIVKDILGDEELQKQLAEYVADITWKVPTNTALTSFVTTVKRTIYCEMRLPGTEHYCNLEKDHDGLCRYTDMGVHPSDNDEDLVPGTCDKETFAACGKVMNWGTQSSCHLKINHEGPCKHK